MRVIHCMASLAPGHGGPTVAALGMVRAQRALGVDARILSSNDDVGQWLDVETNRWVDHQDVPVMFLPRVRAKQHTLVGFTYTPAYGSQLEAQLKDFDFVHVHTVFSHPANVAMRVCRAAGVPYCVRPLGQLCLWSLRQRQWVKKMQLALFTRRNIDGARFVHCTSAMEAEEVRASAFRAPCKILPHGLDVPKHIEDARGKLRRRLNLPPERALVVFMSRLHEKKGVELLIQAAAGVPEDFDLVFVGSGEASYVNELKRAAAQALGARAHWLGFLAGDDKWEALQGADLFVLPSYSENFGIAVLEALACGLPVIVSDQVALQQQVADHGLGRVVSLNIESLAHAMRELLVSAAARSDILSRGPKTIMKDFGWPAAAARLIDAYRDG